ncbi:MAG: TetR/AcrR family transcriptional regulator [Candidatus Limnocylindria bacterium]
MARTVDTVAYAVRRDAFVDVAQRLIQEKGYEQASVQDILDELGASRGAFYHYFDSKEALLEAVIERMEDGALAMLAPVVTAPDLSAIEKLRGVFGNLASWKAARKELMVGLLRSWLADDNAIVREKFRQGLVPLLTPLLADIVRQGVAEGTFKADSPDQVARVLVSLVQGANETAVQLFVARQAGTITFEDVTQTLEAYARAFERLLEAPCGSFPMMDEATLRFWFDDTDELQLHERKDGA